MKLKTSFFNTTVLKKDITRFAPVWGIYGLMLLLYGRIECVPPTHNPLSALDCLGTNATRLLLVNCLYAGVCALVLFGDLYSLRRNEGLHALPVSRAGWFWTHTVAGILFALVPNILFTLQLTVYLSEYWYLAFLWFGAAMLQFVVFFGMAVFCAMCAGSKLGMMIFYVGVNLWSLLLYGVVDTLYAPILYGVIMDINVFAVPIPIAQLSTCQYVDLQWINATQSYMFNGVLWQEYVMTSVYSGIGVILLTVAFWLYRRRDLEAAGSVMALKPAAVVVQVMIALLAAFVLGGLGGMVFGFVGLIPGYFAGKMITQRSVKVFNKKTLTELALLCAVMLTGLAVTAWDPAGIITRTPDPEQVRQVYVSGWCDHGTYGHRTETFVSAQNVGEIERVIRLQHQIIEKRDLMAQEQLYFYYEMNDGTVVERLYPVSMSVVEQVSEQWRENP